MQTNDKCGVLDALYGEIEFDAAVCELVSCPLVQRLRSVRLSNIDSTTMPGIANLSRYEHSIGVAYLTSQVGFRQRIPSKDLLVLQAAGLIHDTAITPFSHLAEEAQHYLGLSYDHEAKWSILLGSNSDEGGALGGVDLQLYLGRESGLRPWAHKIFGVQADEMLGRVFAAIMGKGEYGKCIAGDVDLDNLDNVTRIAFHMGLEVDRKLPLRIAQGIERCSEIDGATFSSSSVDDVNEWLRLRESVYDRLMLSRDDFCGKVMLISASVQAYERNIISPAAWTLTDNEFVEQLLKTTDKDIRNTVERWLLHDLWSLSDLFWLEGMPPDFKTVYSFAKFVSSQLNRHCFAYRIKDKRTRNLPLRISSGERLQLGKEPTKWLLGIASSSHKVFTKTENQRLSVMASEFFTTRSLGSATGVQNNISLFEAV